MKLLHFLLIAVTAALLCSCDDGSQRYSKYKVESDSFTVTKNITEADTAAMPLVESYADYSVYGSGDKRVYVFTKGAEFIYYRDEDWEGYKNLLIKDGEVLDSYILWPGVQDIPGLALISSGDYTKDKYDLTLGEYQTLLEETCPPKAQARRHFMWGNIIVVLCFVVGLFLTIGIAGDKKKKNKQAEAAYEEPKNYTSTEIVLMSIGVLCLLAIPVIIWAYYYLNPDESFWYITDWGFLGFCLGLGYVFATIALPCCSLALVIPAVKKIFTKEWKTGLIELALSCVAIVLSYYFLALIFPQLWDQCGFIFKSIGVIALIVMLPCGLSAGLKSGSNSGPSTVSDGKGTNLDVISSDGNRVITSDGKTRYRSPDGNYREY